MDNIFLQYLIEAEGDPPADEPPPVEEATPDDPPDIPETDMDSPDMDTSDATYDDTSFGSDDGTSEGDEEKAKADDLDYTDIVELLQKQKLYEKYRRTISTIDEIIHDTKEANLSLYYDNELVDKFLNDLSTISGALYSIMINKFKQSYTTLKTRLTESHVALKLLTRDFFRTARPLKADTDNK
jgi:cobalamin biosynthesis protein CobT